MLCMNKSSMRRNGQELICPSISTTFRCVDELDSKSCIMDLSQVGVRVKNSPKDSELH